MSVDPPGSPLDLEFTAINIHSLLLNWSPPQETTTCITNYIIEVNTTEALYTTDNMTSLLISNRSLGSVYLFYVMGRDSGNRTGNISLPLKVIWNGKNISNFSLYINAIYCLVPPLVEGLEENSMNLITIMWKVTHIVYTKLTYFLLAYCQYFIPISWVLFYST